MKKYIVSTLMALTALFTAKAQDFKLAKNSGKLVINLPAVIVEGHSGNEIIFSSLDKMKDEDERAKGLRPISGTGYVDNTGLGINVTDKGNTVEVNQVGNRGEKVKILVPKGVVVSYSYNKVMYAGTASFKNIENEIEVSVQYNKVQLENVTGPLSIKAVYGSVDVKFGQEIKGPVSVVSVYGYVDASIPLTTKADLKMNTSHGEIFASSDFKIEMEKRKDDMISYSHDDVKGKLNGGGTSITLTSNYGKVYLRKNN